jgi:hypothetical protein
MPGRRYEMMELLREVRGLVSNRLLRTVCSVEPLTTRHSRLRAAQLDPALVRSPGACVTNARLLRTATAIISHTGS